MVIAGGGIVEPRPESCLNRAFEIAEASPGLELRALAVSVEPGVRFSWRQRLRLRDQLAGLGPVAVRDVLSGRVLQLIAPDHPIRVVGDIALWTEPGDIPPEIAADVPDEAIAVILQNQWQSQTFFNWMADELAAIAREKERAILLLPFARYGSKDGVTHNRLRDALDKRAPDVSVVWPGETLPPEAVTHGIAAAILARASLCVSMRLHGCVVAYSQKTPFVGLAYHPKLRGFFETVGWERALVPTRLPKRQSKDVYGFSFEDLTLEGGDLLKAARQVEYFEDFSGIAFWRARQLEFVREIFGAA